MIDYSVDGDGIATISWNVTNRPMNVMNEESISAFAAAVDKALGDEGVVGVIVTSSRREFVVGADLDQMRRAWKDAQSIYESGERFQGLFRRMETSEKPFVAAITGHALGGGYEICLACHHRIAADAPRMKIGLPESKVGLLPGAGGTQRLPRLIGIEKALPLMLEGKELDQQKALQTGLVDAVVPADRLLDEAKQWLLTEGPKNVVKPWDQKGFKLPGGAVQSPRGNQTFTVANAMVREKTYGNYPAQLNILSCVFEGCQVDIDTGLKIERRYFAKTALTKEASNLIRFFFSMTEANKLGRRPKDVPKAEFKKMGMLGAGMMGSGIAHVAALAGIDVVLLDTSLEAAEKGKANSAGILQKQVQRGRMSESDARAVSDRIQCTADFADLDGCDLVIEAVFEDRKLKADVTKKAEAVIAETTVFASNTSTLPITGLAEASARPDKFIGMHFFSPVHRMPLVELIRGEKTSDETLAKALDFAKAIKKTPIVVNDSRGFYTSRVFGTYVGEGLALLAEGVTPALIENAGRMAGMPVGALALADEVSIELMYKIKKQTKDDLGDKYGRTSVDDVGELMVGLGRIGKKVGKGFYEYPKDGKKHLWPGLKEHFPLADEQPDVDEVIKRLLYVQSVETARCLEENVVTDPRDADVGSVMGWAFPASRGGTASQIDTGGVSEFVAECDQLSSRFGARFEPPALLRDMAAKGEALHPQ